LLAYVAKSNYFCSDKSKRSKFAEKIPIKLSALFEIHNSLKDNQTDPRTKRRFQLHRRRMMTGKPKSELIFTQFRLFDENESEMERGMLGNVDGG
jgi:hypothetical protein